MRKGMKSLKKVESWRMKRDICEICVTKMILILSHSFSFFFILSHSFVRLTQRKGLEDRICCVVSHYLLCHFPNDAEANNKYHGQNHKQHDIY